MFCLLVLPFDSIRFINASWADVGFLCVLVPFLRYGNVGVSLLSVAAITINRFVFVSFILYLTHCTLLNPAEGFPLIGLSPGARVALE